MNLGEVIDVKTIDSNIMDETYIYLSELLSDLDPEMKNKVEKICKENNVTFEELKLYPQKHPFIVFVVISTLSIILVVNLFKVLAK